MHGKFSLFLTHKYSWYMRKIGTKCMYVKCVFFAFKRIMCANWDDSILNFAKLYASMRSKKSAQQFVNKTIKTPAMRQAHFIDMIHPETSLRFYSICDE